MTCGIYLIENKETGQKYVGQSVDIERRWKQHLLCADRNHSRVDNAINKHGGDKFRLSVITELPVNVDMLNMHEVYWIKFYNTFKDKNHYNLTEGGDGTGSGENHPMWNKHHSDESKQKMSEANSGENHPMYDKHHSEETKKKMSESSKGIFHSDESKQKMSESRNNSGYFYVTKGKCKTCKQGFIWKYRYYDENGKRKTISSVSIDKLEKKVKSKGLKWKKIKGDE